MTDPGENGVEVGARAAPLRVNVVTIFPEFFAGPLALSIPARARAAGAVDYRVVDCGFHARPASHRRRYPYGGGAGYCEARAVLRGGGVAAGAGADRPHVGARPAIHAGRRESLRRRRRVDAARATTRMSTSASPTFATEELSVGDFALSGGEPAALAVIDAIVVASPRAMSDLESARTIHSSTASRPFRATRVPPTFTDTRCPRSCSPAPTRRSRHGDAPRRSASRAFAASDRRWGRVRRAARARRRWARRSPWHPWRQRGSRSLGCRGRRGSGSP